MEHLPEIIKAMADWGVSPLNLLLMGMLYFLMVKMNILPAFWKTEQKEHIPSWAEHLLQNYNHSTTSFHETTHAKLDSLLEKEKDEQEKIDTIEKGVGSIQATLTEFKEYGIKSRVKAR